MPDMPREIYTVDAVRQIDRAAIDDEGIAGYTLMCRAGNAALGAILKEFPAARNLTIICGPGNNGGDGYVVARLAVDAGVAVSVISMGDPDKLSGDASTAHKNFLANGGVTHAWSGTLEPNADVIVDAMFGSGLQRPVSGAFADAIAEVNKHTAAVVALDIPSGVHGDSGDVLGCAVEADLTITFVGLKAGLFNGAGSGHCGRIEFAALEIPVRCRRGLQPVFMRLDDALVKSVLPKRKRDAHKGDFGHVLVVGGGEGMPGAALLCGEAALRSGAGRVSLATDSGHAASIAAARPELMTHGVDDADALQPLLEKADVIAFGPGLGQSAWAESLYAAVVSAGKPSVWDADALNLLARNGSRDEKRIITPHPGEAGRLLGTSARDVQNDRRAALLALQERYGGTVVLKGAGTLVTSDNDAPWICTAGNPGMAAPGMGDVLTGIIAALIAQGLATSDAAPAAVQVHARAGDVAAGSGERGMLAGDLVGQLRGAVNP